MARPFTLTHQPIRVTSTPPPPTLQPIYLALDVSAFDILDIELGIIGLEGTGTGVTVNVWTGMQNQVDDGWLALSTFSTMTAADTFAKQTFQGGFLKYLRWRVDSLGGYTATTFYIRGMGRSYR